MAIFVSLGHQELTLGSIVLLWAQKKRVGRGGGSEKQCGRKQFKGNFIYFCCPNQRFLVGIFGSVYVDDGDSYKGVDLKVLMCLLADTACDFVRRLYLN